LFNFACPTAPLVHNGELIRAQIVLGTVEGKRQIKRRSRRWEDINKMVRNAV